MLRLYVPYPYCLLITKKAVYVYTERGLKLNTMLTVKIFITTFNNEFNNLTQICTGLDDRENMPRLPTWTRELFHLKASRSEMRPDQLPVPRERSAISTEGKAARGVKFTTSIQWRDLRISEVTCTFPLPQISSW